MSAVVKAMLFLLRVEVLRVSMVDSLGRYLEQMPELVAAWACLGPPGDGPRRG